MAKRKQIQRRDEGMADFQNANCKKGCRFANEEKVGSGLPCCRYGSHLISDGETCYSRVTLGKDPTFTCQVCKREVKYSDLPNSIGGGRKDTLYEVRVCNWECARKINEGGN